MAYINIDIEDHLDEVDTSELIDELKRRKLSRSEQKEINKWKIEDYKDEAMSLLGLNSLRDVIKFEAFMECFKNIPETDLDEFLKKYR